MVKEVWIRENFPAWINPHRPHITAFQAVQKYEEKGNAWSAPDLLPTPKCVHKWTRSVWQLWECHRMQFPLGNPHLQSVSVENTCSIKWVLITGCLGFTRCVMCNSWNKHVNPLQKSGKTSLVYQSCRYLKGWLTFKKRPSCEWAGSEQKDGVLVPSNGLPEPAPFSAFFLQKAPPSRPLRHKDY